MNEIVLAVIAIVMGLIILVKSADWLVDSAQTLSLGLGVKPFLVGVVVLGFGTSAPEIGVSITSAIEGLPNLAVGNVLGSNIANVALVLSVSMLLNTLIITRSVLKVDLPMLLLVTAVSGWVLWDGVLNQTEALMLLAAFGLSLGLIIQQSLTSPDCAEALEEASSKVDAKTVGWLLVSLALLPLSAKMLVWGASIIAVTLGVSELVIGLTIVAIGTSLPELAAAVAAAMKKEKDLIIGNIIGSNLFNLGIVLPISASLGSYAIDPEAMSLDFPFMAGLTLFLLIPTLMGKTQKWQGVLLLTAFFGYLAMLYMRSVV